MERLISIISETYIKYENDDEILNILIQKINEIPNTLIKMKHEENKNKQSTNIIKYAIRFLNHPSNQYFYIKSSESFVKYNSEHYNIVNEDEIWHAVYTYLKDDQPQIKHQIKNTIIKYIQNKTIFKSIPESKTIQNVINFLYPTIFTSKEEAKYFLSIIGDNILKKNRHIIHYFSRISKPFISCLNDNIYDLITTSTSSSIKWRCYRHNFANCRILKFNKAVLSTHCWISFLKTNILDILAVASHYSERYNGSEEYITKHLLDSKIKNHILYLKNKSENDVVDDFIKSYLTITIENKKEVNWDTVYFVWKRYLTENDYPNLLFIEPLKKRIILKFKYNEDKEIFTNISSPALDKIINLQKFWSETISEVNKGDISLHMYGYEIGEICNLYRQWLDIDDPNLLIDQETLKAIIEYFYPKIIITDNKYIDNIQCSLWCKWYDINAWIEYYKSVIDKTISKISISSLYHNYCDYKKSKVQNNSVSKDYFTKYFKANIPPKYFDENLIVQTYFN